MIPPPAPSRSTAKYNIGVATIPMSTTPTPSRVTPRTRASPSAGELERASRPITNSGAARKRAVARPIR